jgi:hypothetical protein
MEHPQEVLYRRRPNVTAEDAESAEKEISCKFRE